MLAREPLAERAARAVDGAAVDAAVGTREVHVLEHAAPRLQLRQRMRRLHAVAVDRHDLSRLDVALVGGADDVERAGLGREDDGVAEPAHRQRPPAARIARGEQRVAHRDDQAVGAVHALQRVGQAQRGRRRRGARELVDDDLGVVRRGEDRPLVLELVTHLGGVDQVAVVGERDEAALRARDDGLRVVDCRRAGGAVARVADGRRPRDLRELMRERIRERAHPAHGARLSGVVDRHDADRLLTAMLEGVQAELRDMRRVGMAVDSENAAHEFRSWLRSRRSLSPPLSLRGERRLGHDPGNRFVIRGVEPRERRDDARRLR